MLFQLLSCEDFLPFSPERAKQDVFLFWPNNWNILTFLLFYSQNYFHTLVWNAKNWTLPAGLFSDHFGGKSESECQEKVSISSILDMNVESPASFTANITGPIFIILMIYLRKKRTNSFKIVNKNDLKLFCSFNIIQSNIIFSWKHQIVWYRVMRFKTSDTPLKLLKPWLRSSIYPPKPQNKNVGKQSRMTLIVTYFKTDKFHILTLKAEPGPVVMCENTARVPPGHCRDDVTDTDCVTSWKGTSTPPHKCCHEAVTFTRVRWTTGAYKAADGAEVVPSAPPFKEGLELRNPATFPQVSCCCSVT